MSGLGVGIAILHEGQILLIQRADFEVWGLPGGMIDPGETAAQAAVREALEETGFQVELTALVGLYATPQFSMMGMDTHVAVFGARIVGGNLISTTDETLDARFFSPDDLPDTLMPHHRTRILDAIEGIGGSIVCAQRFEMNIPTNVTSRNQLYKLANDAGSAKARLFIQALQSINETVEISKPTPTERNA